MKKRLQSIIVVGLSLFAAQNLLAREGDKIPNRGCGSMEYREMEEKANPALKAIRQQIDDEVASYILNHKGGMSTQAVITIPCVFHIVYNGAAENVSDNCINKTLQAFNDDFRKMNSDFATKCPSVFQSVAADCEIQFCLASKDPSGAATNGITRTSTSVTAFSTDNKVKYTAQGGHDVWDRNKYVNFWICDLGSSLLGYGQFPGGSAATDGVVCHYLYLVQSGGCGNQPYHLGRTTVHEVGHFFNLRHIWGDANCGNDLIADTPTSQTSNFGCPTFPHVTCSNGPNGDMFCNYMDYTDDACMVMFTAGQKAAMLAALNGSTRSGLKTSAATNCTGGGNAVNELNISEFVSVFPNPATGSFSMTMNIEDVHNAQMVIYNQLGEAVLEKKITVPSGTNLDVDMTGKPDGMYTIKVKTAQGTITKKVIITQ